MKKVKRTISLIIAAIMLLSTMSVLAFADKLPTYAEATAKEVGPHDCVAAVVNGVVVKTLDESKYAQPTCTKGGIAEYVINCAVCGKELSREKIYLPKLTSHVPADKISIEKVVAPTCAKEGSYYEVTRCKFCNEVLESTKVIVSKTTAHVAGTPRKENIVNATCKKVGSYDSVIYCKVCGKELQRTFKEIPKLTYHVSEYSLDRRVYLDGTKATVVFENANYKDLKKSGNGIFDNGIFLAAGWFVNGKTRTCADGEERCAICGELLNPSIPHVWDKGVTTRRATLTTPGEITYTCLIDGCGATKTVNTPVKAPSTGDVNVDGAVTPADARLVLRYSVGLGNFDKVITGALVKVADYDGNGKVEPADARLILRTAVGLPN